METLAYYNGKYATADEMTIPFNDRVNFFGDGVYEATTTRNYKIFALDEHVDRIFNSAKLIDINIDMTKEEMKEILCDLVKKLDSPTQFVYWQITRGSHVRNHTYPEGMKSNFWVLLKPFKDINFDVETKVITHIDTRFLHCNIKTLNLIPAVLYATEAERAGCQEAILYREGGRVTECSHSNVHIINKDGVLQTAPLDNLILPGIARKHLLNAAKDLGIAVDETPFQVEDLFTAREVLTTSSTTVIRRVRNVDGKEVGGADGETVAKLREWLKNEYLTETN